MLTNHQIALITCSSTKDFPTVDRVLRTILTYIRRYEESPRINDLVPRIHFMNSSGVKSDVMSLSESGLIELYPCGRAFRCRITNKGYERLTEIAEILGGENQ